MILTSVMSAFFICFWNGHKPRRPASSCAICCGKKSTVRNMGAANQKIALLKHTAPRTGFPPPPIKLHEARNKQGGRENQQPWPDRQKHCTRARCAESGKERQWGQQAREPMALKIAATGAA
jgi:hypothetical protein